MFYFAWVDKEDSTFSETEHMVEDEQVFSLSISHAEGDFPSLDVELLNPRVGLLSAGRKQWAWLSYDDGSTVFPLFFGRLVAVPQDLHLEVVRLTFVARPVDYDAQRDTLADTLRVAPFYDPIWLSPDERLDPDRVLEGRPSIWHIDRLTHVVTVSDIVTGEAGLLEFDETQVFHDSVSISYGQSPARRVRVVAGTQWKQKGSGSIDVTNQVLAAFDGHTPPGRVLDIGGDVRPSDGVIAAVTGEQLVSNWPNPGRSVGAGWKVGQGTGIQVVGNLPTKPTLIGDFAVLNALRGWIADANGPQTWMLRQAFGRSPGTIVQIIDHTDPAYEFTAHAIGAVDFLWLPIWRLAPTLVMEWETERNRLETVSFDVLADVQPLLTDPGDEETVILNLGPVDVDAEIGDVRRDRYFATVRGRQSFENLLARARAILLSRSRAVEIEFQVPFPLGLDLSCRYSAAISDPRLPDGVAAGKVVRYTLSMDGNSGAMAATVVIGCTVGRNGVIEEVDGDPLYVEEGYVDTGYQVYDGNLIVPLAGTIGYEDLSAYPIDTDGVNLLSVGAGYLLGVSVSGGLDVQTETESPAASGIEVIDRINSAKTTLVVQMRPILNDEFQTAIVPVVTELMIPRTINLE